MTGSNGTTPLWAFESVYKLRAACANRNPLTWRQPHRCAVLHREGVPSIVTRRTSWSIKSPPCISACQRRVDALVDGGNGCGARATARHSNRANQFQGAQPTQNKRNSTTVLLCDARFSVLGQSYNAANPPERHLADTGQADLSVSKQFYPPPCATEAPSHKEMLFGFESAASCHLGTTRRCSLISHFHFDRAVIHSAAVDLTSPEL